MQSNCMELPTTASEDVYLPPTYQGVQLLEPNDESAWALVQLVKQHVVSVAAWTKSYSKMKTAAFTSKMPSVVGHHVQLLW